MPDVAVGAFRVEAALPGNIARALADAGHELEFAIESELVEGVASAQTTAPYPKAHLRRTTASHVADRRPASFVLRRDLPVESDPARALELERKLRHQSGYNRFVSPWVVPIADPRASELWIWPAGQQPQLEGCASCRRPIHLQSVAEPEAFELLTAGRFISVRPEGSAFAGTPYAYLADNRRLGARVSTTPADIVRPPSVLTAAQHPPVAEGLLQGTVYLHSGELQTDAIDLDAGGRSGWNVVADRTYRSRSIGISPLGAGWTSSIFRRLRELPNGDVEYRDGAGETWRFVAAGGRYVAPTGVFLKLVRTPEGWSIIDQKWRISSFDALGRLITESDEWYDLTKPGSGNLVSYVYDERGRLARIVDPVNRVTQLSYFGDDSATPGLLREIADWHSSPRRITYEYDGASRLVSVKLPDVANTQNVRPEIRYAYAATGQSLNDQLELAPNLASITDPNEVAQNGPARVQFTFDTSSQRDRLMSQQWATGEAASFSWPSPDGASVTDVLGQVRTYVLTTNNPIDPSADRAHVVEARETAVEIWKDASFGQLPGILMAAPPQSIATERVRRYAYADGALQSSKIDGIGAISLTWNSGAGAPGKVVTESTTAPDAAAASKAGSLALPATTAITRKIAYQTVANGSTFVRRVEANGLAIDSPEPHRELTQPESVNDSVAAKQRFTTGGQLVEFSSSGGIDTGSAGAEGAITYLPVTTAPHARSLPRTMREGEVASGLVTTFDYPTESRTLETDPRGVVTTTDYDTWQRPVRVHVSRPGEPLGLEQKFEYDASGRLVRTLVSKDAGYVTTTYRYDAMGRQIESTTDGIASVGTVTTTTEYNLPTGRVVNRHSGGAVTTTSLDRLGRTRHTTTETGGTPIEQHVAYDLAGNPVFSTDLFSAAATAWDVHGRTIATKSITGVASVTSYDAWDRPTEAKTYDALGRTVAAQTFDFTPAGRLQSVRTQVDEEHFRTTDLAWDGGGRTSSAATNGRAARSVFDAAGRSLRSFAGAGSLGEIAQPFATTEVSAFSGALPATTVATDRSGAAVTASTEHNGFGDVVRQSVGPLEWKQSFDQLGNVTEASLPARPASQWKADARGAVTEERKPDGATIAYGYSATGAPASYLDPTNEKTTTATDFIGRPVHRDYPDGTSEVIEWFGPRLVSVTDRQGRAQRFVYNEKNQLTEVRDGSGALLERREYDAASRLVGLTTPDAKLTWENFTLDGKPRRTTQTRYRNAGAFGGGEVLDSYTHEHRWNEHGERVRWSMPSYAGLSLGSGWTTWVRESYDAAGNVATIEKVDGEFAGSGTTLMEATHRGPGRPETRTLFGAGGVPIVRTYGYEESTGRMNRMAVSVNGREIAGSEVTFDGLQRASARQLGMSNGERMTYWTYDDRGRLRASIHGVRGEADPEAGVPGSATEVLTPADFRTAQERVTWLDEATRAAMAAKGVDVNAIDPPTMTFAEKPGGGHKIASVTQGDETRAFHYNAAEVVDDGRFVYEFNAKGRLVRATEKGPGVPRRRILYFYAGNDRLVGRRAEYAIAIDPIESDWKLEDRAEVLGDDALPAESTFVWDAITDRLVVMAAAGANAAMPHGGIVRQFVHGDQAYDDPIEVTLVDPGTNAATQLFPIYDEAGAFVLDSVINAKGELAWRNLPGDPYGAHAATMAGPAVERIELTATKDASDALAEIAISVYATDPVDAATVAEGLRLEALDADGHVLRSVANPPQLFDNKAVWTLPAGEWTAFAGGAESIAVRVTSALRSATWGADVPFTDSDDSDATDGNRVDARVAIATTEALVARAAADGSATTTVYEPGLAGAVDGENSALQLGAAAFHAYPFVEPADGKVYARARWYDAETGTFVSPDPMGYRDSANSYVFSGTDPVNDRDPRGECQQAPGSPPCSDLEIEVSGKKPTSLEYWTTSIGLIAREGPGVAGLLTATPGALNDIWESDQKRAAFESQVVRGIVPIGFGSIGPNALRPISPSVPTSASTALQTPVAGTKLLKSAGESSQTIRQVTELRGTNLQRGQVFNEYLAPKGPPNPGGRLGDAVTRQTAQNVIRDLIAKGFTDIRQEVRFLKGALGQKERFVDIVARNPRTGETVLVQIGKMTKSGVPIIRERRALDDIIFSPTIKKFVDAVIMFVEKGSGGI
jgi:RHS repeat-associated protein